MASTDWDRSSELTNKLEASVDWLQSQNLQFTEVNHVEAKRTAWITKTLQET